MTQFDPKKLGEEADELIRQQAKQASEGETQPEEETIEEETQAQAEEAEAVQEEAIAQAESTAATDQGIESDEVIAEEATADSSKVLEQMQKQIDAAEQRWKVLQGMITKKDAELDAMRDLLASINQQKVQEEPAPKQEPVTLVTEDDVKEYGKEYVDFMTRLAKQTFLNESGNADFAGLAARLDALEGSVKGVEQTSANTAQTMFLTDLGAVVPDWRDLNTDPSFLKWLDQVDTFTGEPRLGLLQLAVNNNDAARAAAFFNAYKQETGQVTKPATEPAPASRGKEKLVAPGKAKTATATPEAKRTWTNASIAKLYDDKMKGRISQKEFDKLERDLFAAQAEGRITAAA